jgi:hypothetical protein
VVAHQRLVPRLHFLSGQSLQVIEIAAFFSLRQ